MKKGIIIGAACALTAGCAYVHRNVIKALIEGEPIPKAPDWHFWVKEENRRSAAEDAAEDLMDAAEEAAAAAEEAAEEAQDAFEQF